jgi:hypothetical protein
VTKDLGPVIKEGIDWHSIVEVVRFDSLAGDDATLAAAKTNNRDNEEGSHKMKCGTCTVMH